MECSNCGSWVDDVGLKVKRVTCSRCVQGLVGAPEIKPTVPRIPYELRKLRKEMKNMSGDSVVVPSNTVNKGRGWHLKKLVEIDGTFYSFGKIVDSATAQELQKAIEADALAKATPKKRGRPVGSGKKNAPVA